MKKFKSLVLAVIGLLCSISVSAEDFEVEGIYYNITSSTDMTVEVTYRGDSYYSPDFIIFLRHQIAHIDYQVVMKN